MSDSTRIDKWLWAARFFKTRSLATDAVSLGRVLQNGARVKPAHAIKIDDELEIHVAEQTWTVHVFRISETRGSATIAQTLYAETAESQQRRIDVAMQRKLYKEPSAQITGRPTKRDRRQMDYARTGGLSGDS